MPNECKTPFCWQDKRVLRCIREHCEDYASALAVYVALTVAASDAGREEFQTTHQWLAILSGFGERTVRSRLRDLERIQAVSITTPTLKAPCTYRLLPFGNGCQASGNGCRTFGKVLGKPLPPSEEKKKRIPEAELESGAEQQTAGNPERGKLLRQTFQKGIR